MVVAAFERESTHDEIKDQKRRLINRVFQKIRNEQNITDWIINFISEKLEEINEQEKKEKRKITTLDDVLIDSLEKLKEDSGGFLPEKLGKRFEKLKIEKAAQEIVEKLKEKTKEIKRELLHYYGVKLKKEGIDTKNLETRVDELLEN